MGVAESIRRDDPIHCEGSRAIVEETEELGKGVRGRGYLWVTKRSGCLGGRQPERRKKENMEEGEEGVIMHQCLNLCRCCVYEVNKLINKYRTWLTRRGKVRT